MNTPFAVRALNVTLLALAVTAPARAAVLLDQVAETAAIATYSTLLAPDFAFAPDADQGTTTSTSSTTLAGPAGDTASASATSTVDGDVGTFAAAGGPAEDTAPLAATAVALWAAVYQAQAASPGGTVDADVTVHVSGTLTLSDAGVSLAGLLGADVGASLVIVGDLGPTGVFTSTTPFGLFDAAASLGIDGSGAYTLTRNGDWASSAFDPSFVLGPGCDGSGACTVTVSADVALSDAFTLNDGDQFGVLFTMNSSAFATGAGAVGAESDFLSTGTLSFASSTGGTFALIATAVTEPASFLLLAAGLVTFLYARSREPDGVRQRGSRRAG